MKIDLCPFDNFLQERVVEIRHCFKTALKPQSSSRQSPGHCLRHRRRRRRHGAATLRLKASLGLLGMEKGAWKGREGERERACSLLSTQLTNLDKCACLPTRRLSCLPASTHPQRARLAAHGHPHVSPTKLIPPCRIGLKGRDCGPQCDSDR